MRPSRKVTSSTARLAGVPLLLVAGLVAMACGTGDGPNGPLESLTISPARGYLTVGETRRFVANGHYADGSVHDVSDEVTWAIDRPDTASIDETGLVRGLAIGDAAISARTRFGRQGSATISVEHYRHDGAWDAPLTLPLDTPFEGSVGSGESHYVVDVDPRRAYYVFLHAVTDGLSLSVYDNPARTRALCRDDADEELVCVIAPVLDGDSLYLVVASPYRADDRPIGGEYVLEVVPGWLDEGGYDTPLTLTLGTTHAGGVGLGTSYYQVTTVPGAEYRVQLANATAPVALDLRQTGECSDGHPVPWDQHCALRANGDALALSVGADGTRAGAGYEIKVEQTGPALHSEGIPGAPQVLEVGVPWDGQVVESSYYVFASVPGRSYRVRVEDALSGTYLAVYDGDSSFTTPICEVPVSAAGCEVEQAGTDKVYARVRMDPSPWGTRFRILVEEVSWSAEGAEAPLLLAAPPTLHFGQVDATTSRYEVPVTAGAQYRVWVRNPACDVNLAVYGDSELSAILCTSSHEGLADESCFTEPPPAGDRLFVVVESADGWAGGSYSLSIDELYYSEGTRSAPVALGVGEARACQVGPVELSWYLVQVQPGATYQVDVSGTANAPSYQILEDVETLTGQRCWSQGAPCRLEPATTDEVLIVVGSSAPGSAFDMTVTSVPYLSEGSPQTPIDLGPLPVTHQGHTDTSASYYRVAVEDGAVYAIELTGLAVTADLRVYGDSALTIPLCASTSPGVADESCLAEATGPDLFVVVDGSASEVGAMYSLAVHRR